jgi:hypothetical protein
MFMIRTALSYTALLLALQLPTGCAKADYIDAQGEVTDTDGNKAETRSCDLRFPAHGLCASVVWRKAPAKNVDSPFSLSFWREASGPASANVKITDGLAVELWMDSMGHGSAPVEIAENSAASSYEVTRVMFIMAGDWSVRVTLGSGAQKERAALYLLVP